jgi:hypothetical protein
MKTYVINKIEEMEQFKDNYGYICHGNLELKISVSLFGRLKVAGYIEAGEYIEAGR